MAQHLRCVVRSDDEVITVRPEGILDRGTANQLRLILTKASIELPLAIVVDLADLRIADAATMTVFLTVAGPANGDPGVPILLCAARRDAADSFFALGLDRTLSLYRNCDEASRLARSQREDYVRRRLWPTPDAPSRARGFTAATCAQWRVPAAAEQSLQVIATELVTNAVVHAGTPLVVVLRRSHRTIKIAVIDQDERLATLRRVDPSSVSGRGLMLVEAFASTWGCAETTRGKCTWASISYSPLP
jgi:anti-anti-sigma regulatory factor/anti-sigma regulatory factor (Ser/Thr protein kinase)